MIDFLGFFRAEPQGTLRAKFENRSQSQARAGLSGADAFLAPKMGRLMVRPDENFLGERINKMGSENISVKMSNVSKTYRKGKSSVVVLSNLNFEVAEGEFVALMGPSGSGKTTLLNLMGGLDHPDSGEVIVDGHRIERFGNSELTAWRAHNVGFVFQSYNLLSVLTAQKNVELPLSLRKMSGSEKTRRALNALKLVGLEDRAKHYPGELSGGQEQRVGIARAIVSDPALILADEPTGDLDRQSAQEIMALLKSLNRDHGKTIVMVTHDPEAASCATRLVKLEKGQLAKGA